MATYPQLRQLINLFVALFAGQLLFALVVTYLGSGPTVEPRSVMSFRFLVPAALIGAATIVLILNGQQRQVAPTLQNIEAKLQHYRQRVLIRLAILEGANFLAIIAALLTHHLNYLLLFLIGLALFIYYRPTRAEFARDYEV